MRGTRRGPEVKSKECPEGMGRTRCGWRTRVDCERNARFAAKLLASDSSGRAAAAPAMRSRGLAMASPRRGSSSPPHGIALWIKPDVRLYISFTFGLSWAMTATKVIQAAVFCSERAAGVWKVAGVGAREDYKSV